MLRVLQRSVLLPSIERCRQAREDVDIYVAPPVEQFDLLDFRAIDRVVEAGRRFALEHISKWKEDLDAHSESVGRP